MNYPVRKDDHHRFLEDAMQYALLIYAAPSSREDESRCDGGVFGSWIDCTQALKSAGALLEAEQLCHPAPALEVRAGLPLRYLAGLRTREIANAFLVPEPTMAKRLGCPLPMPSDRDWRRFTGSSVSCSTRDTQPPAAIRWSEPSCAARPSGWDCCCTACCRTTPARPDAAATAALLALMLLHHSRGHVRQGLDGRPVPLAEQDRARWDHEMIREGVAQLDAAILRGSPGAYQLQAAIAALHARAASFE